VAGSSPHVPSTPWEVKEAVRERKGNLRFFPLPYTPQGLGYTGLGDPKLTETWPWESMLLSHLSQLSHLLHHPLQVPVLGILGSWVHLTALGFLELALWSKNADVRPPADWD